MQACQPETKTEPQKSSRSSEYVKIPHVPGLYRHTKSGRYYGEKKVQGKRKERSLGTTDRRIAETRLKAWIANLGKVDTEVEKTTLKELIQRFKRVNQGMSDSTIATVNSILKELQSSFTEKGIDTEVRSIRPSDLEAWLALSCKGLKNTTYNRYAGVLKQLFEMAVKDRIISESPFEGVRTRWKKPQTPIRRVPTVDEFQSIVDDVRNEIRSCRHNESADFLEFLGLAGVGQAEASSLTWGDVDFTRNVLSFRRHKTDKRFTMPLYAHLRPLLERLRKETGGNPSSALRVLKINDAKKALTNACARLGLPRFSQRNLRQCLIRRLWQSGVDRKLIAKWQGHQDGGQLILDTYTEVFGSDDEEYELQQLAKLETSAPPPNRPTDAEPMPFTIVPKSNAA